MMYHVGYTRSATEGLVEVSNLPLQEKWIMKKLNLEGLKGTDEVESLFWKPISNGWYGMISVKSLMDKAEDERRIPLICGYVMPQEDAESLLAHPEQIYALWKELKMDTKQDILDIPGKHPSRIPAYDSSQPEWVEINECHVLRLLTYILEDNGQKLCAFLDADKDQMFWVLKILPTSIRQTLSFCIGFNGAGAGAGTVNLTSPALMDKLRAENWEGFPAGRNLIADSGNEFTEQSHNRAEALFQLYQKAPNSPILREYDSRKVLRCLDLYQLLILYQSGDKTVLSRLKDANPEELTVLFPLLEKKPDQKLRKLVGLVEKKSVISRKETATEPKAHDTELRETMMLIVAALLFVLTAFQYLPSDVPGTITLVLSGTGAVRLLTAALLGFALGRYLK